MFAHAYIGSVGANIQTLNFARCLPGMYDIPMIDIAVRCVFTNTTTTAPYRGAGRPEANFILERVIDEAARMTGIDPIKLRRRNLIKPAAMPYKTAIGTTIDSGEFETILDKALSLADYDGFKQRRREAAKRRKQIQDSLREMEAFCKHRDKGKGGGKGAAAANTEARNNHVPLTRQQHSSTKD